jgi:hypothetical protein
MHPFLQAQLAALHENDVKAEIARARGRAPREWGGDATNGTRRSHADVVIRRATSGDGPALAALSALDAAPVPLGPALVAEVAGVPTAVLPLDGGRAFGDPFTPTDELVALLELRAAQIRRQAGPSAPNRRRGPLAWATSAAD